MKVAFGTVRDGRVVVEEGGEPLAEGQRVAIVVEEVEGWVLDQAGTQDLLEAMAECDRGEVASESDVLASLARRR